MLSRIAVATALIASPLVWSMANENTALVKTYAAGVLAAAVLFAGGALPLWRAIGPAWPVHALVLLGLLGAAVSPSPSFAWPAAGLALSLWVLAAAAARSSARPAFCAGCRLEMECLGGCKAAAEVCYGDYHAEDPFLRANKSAALKIK